MPAKFANIAFNLPIASLFTYIIPPALQNNLQTGMRVTAPFGKRKITGIVLDFSDKTDVKGLKPIINILDTEPSLNKEVIEFCKWVSDYYICPIGEVVFSAIPKSILVESKIVYSVSGLPNEYKLSDIQSEIVDALETKPMTLKQLENKLKRQSLRSILDTLVRNNVISQEIVNSKEKVKTKYEKYARFDLLDEFREFTNNMIENFCVENKLRTGCHRDLLKYLIQNNVSEMKMSRLIKESGSSLSAVNTFAKKELLTIFPKKVERYESNEFKETAKVFELNKDQEDVLEKINSSINNNEFRPYLLFGVTGSGKTQVYIEAIKNVTTKNKTAIVLVPEIALTPQLIHRFKNYFGDTIGVMHSKLSEGQRFDVFNNINTGKINIIIGARSALFAPLNNLGIIIVDEEHDQSYKQTEKNPRYNARDCSIMRAKMNNAVVILGSATPSLETFYNIKAGKYELIELPHKALKTKQPKVEIVNMLDELKSKSKFIKHETPEQRFLSGKLVSYIQEALDKKQNVILLQNRRGYSAYQECQSCGNVKMCPNCDITLIYHKLKNHLRCHYCGHVEDIQTVCEKCSSMDLQLKGTGTEKVEEEIQRVFPKAKLKRMDADTVKRKDAHAKILQGFHDGEFDILIGTQMISKGLDFPNVSLVGVISADVGLMNPDFRAFERTFQLLMQVAGRSGRSDDYGRVVIQTMHSDNHIFPLVKEHDYVSFFEKEVSYRSNFGYPPFSRMTLIEVSGKEQSRINSIASRIYLYLENSLKKMSESSPEKKPGVEIMKPSQALIFKIKNKYRYHIIIKSLKSADDSWSKTEWLLKQLERKIEEMKLAASERVTIDVDPLSFY